MADPSLDLELFAGAGGMAVGLQRAGFTPSRLFERDTNSCRTLESNLGGPRPTIFGDVTEVDVSLVDWGPYAGKVRLLAAGAPCQAFSVAGKHRAHRDGRNLFPEVLRAVRQVLPDAVLIENVRGLLRPDFKPYIEYVVRQLEWPDVHPRATESWQEHDLRIQKHVRAKDDPPSYHVRLACLNAADFGVPQVRQRVFIVATRRGLLPYAFPAPTHSREALVASIASGAYQAKHGLRVPREATSDTSLLLDEMRLKPWVTVRTVLSDLRDPTDDSGTAWQNHWRIPGARLYARHKGSDLDWPSKTIKAGVHGVPGGENIIHLDDGGYRYYTLREAARLQTFPDRHVFVGTRTAITKQIGNAVPCRLAEAVAKPLFALLSSPNRRKS